LSSVASSVIGFSAGIADGCDRLVDPSVEGGERARQRRFIAVLLAGPFLIGAAWPVIFAAEMGGSKGFVALGAMFCLAWSLVVAIASNANMRVVSGAALAGSTAIITLAIAGAGGLASPALLLAAALAVESWWIGRSAKALAWGGAAAAVAVIAQPVLAIAIGQPAGFTPWHWLVPVLYGAIAAPRLFAAIGEELEAMRQPREASVEDVIDAAILRIGPTGEIVDAGGRTGELIGVKAEMLLGEGFFERVHVADRVAYLQALAGLRASAASQSLEVRIRAAGDGMSAPVFRVLRAEMHAGAPAIMILRDNATIEALRSELASVREQASGSEIAKARFLAAVSHELRTPLNAIIGFSDMLAYEMVGTFSDPRQKEYACLIRDSGAHLLGVVNSILDVSKIESGAYPIQPEPFRFADAASACHAMLAMQAAAKSIEFQNCVTPAVGEICADRRAVQQVLINLLSNAVKFTPEGGSVRLDARRQGRMLVFEVSDTGIGIAEDDLARLCRPFVQVQNDYTRQFDGAGLGLSIAKGLVELHEGALSIQSAPGAGTVVRVSLPLEHQAVAPVRPEAAAQAGDREYGDAAFRKSA
jgi:cell cycle sensor histidine kinase DivJ